MLGSLYHRNVLYASFSCNRLLDDEKVPFSELGKDARKNRADALKLTKKINPGVGIPNHYGMFASNTEDPKKYTSRIQNSFEMEFNKKYEIEDLFLKGCRKYV